FGRDVSGFDDGSPTFCDAFELKGGFLWVTCNRVQSLGEQFAVNIRGSERAQNLALKHGADRIRHTRRHQDKLIELDIKVEIAGLNHGGHVRGELRPSGARDPKRFQAAVLDVRKHAGGSHKASGDLAADQVGHDLSVAAI